MEIKQIFRLREAVGKLGCARIKLRACPKRSISVTIEKELLEWVDKQVKSLRFRSRSHTVEYALHKLRQEDREKHRP